MTETPQTCTARIGDRYGDLPNGQPRDRVLMGVDGKDQWVPNYQCTLPPHADDQLHGNEAHDIMWGSTSRQL